MRSIWRLSLIHILMKTDIQEMKDGYKMEVDLPGFKKDEITVELDDGFFLLLAQVVGESYGQRSFRLPGQE